MLELSAVLVLLILALLGGVVVGVCLARPSPPAPPPEPEPFEPPAQAPPEPPAPDPRLSGIRLRFLDATRPIASALLARGTGPAPDAEVEQLAGQLSALAADGWGVGVSDLREALSESSGLPPEVVDYAVRAALVALEGRDA